MKFDFLRRIYLSDTDAAGVVYFAKGLEICHQAYEESLIWGGISLKQMIQEGKIALPIVHAEIDFLRPLFCGDRIQISLVASLINDSEFAIAYQISPVDHLEQILVKAQTRHICINPQIRQRIDLPAMILKWLRV
ncbi:MAG: acyl-CoA thioesterase [Pleurocapsa sp. SU_5_0]|nr:acyl-CoA thioesterase [Pleurocapsa sp. SU_5_0]NJR44360.1 acyl-CoA thioesterase [Hyellaceae cyanobacterium CSU_1_1]